MSWFTFWLIFFIVAGFAIYIIIIKSKAKETNKRLSLNESPMDILKRRLARGEITEGEFERLKKDMET